VDVRRVLPVLVAAGLLAGCMSEGAEAPLTVRPAATTATGTAAERASELAAARERWQVEGADDYVMDVELTCFCPAGVYRVSVRDGEVADARQLTSATAASGVRLDLSVEGLFAQAEEHLGASVLDVEYDVRSGYPKVLRIDPLANAIDDEVDFRVQAYMPVRQ
jgi:hypothetical protein